MDIWDKEYLDKEDIEELCKTTEGKRRLFLYIMRERITHGLAALFYELDIPVPTPEKQERACEIMWDVLLRKPPWELFEDKKQVEHYKKHGITPIKPTDLWKLRPKGEA